MARRGHFERLSEERARGNAGRHHAHIPHANIVPWTSPENLLVGYKNRIKIADLGVARFLNIDRSSAAVNKMEGTYHFWAPECLDGDKFSPFLADVWALGVCAYVFVYGSLPFDAPTIPDMFDTIMQTDVSFPTGVKMTDTFLDFLRSMLRKDPQQRPSIGALGRHEWLGKGWRRDTSRWPTAEILAVNEADVANAFGIRAMDIAKIKVKMERWRARSANNRKLRDTLRAHLATLSNGEIKTYLRSKGVPCDYFMEKSELDDLAEKTLARDVGDLGVEAAIGNTTPRPTRESLAAPPPSKGCCAVS